MLTRSRFLILTALSLLLLILVAVNISLFLSNRSLQAEQAEKARFLQESLKLEPAYRALIQSLARLANDRQDDNLRGLLSSQGITIDTAASGNQQR